MNTTNPWGLSPREAAMMRALCRTGSSKGAARELGVTVKTIESSFSRAKAKIGIYQRLLCLLAWDRFERPYFDNDELVAALEALIASYRTKAAP